MSIDGDVRARVGGRIGADRGRLAVVCFRRGIIHPRGVRRLVDVAKPEHAGACRKRRQHHDEKLPHGHPTAPVAMTTSS
jgi:hypothetical protein